MNILEMKYGVYRTLTTAQADWNFRF